VSKKYQSWEEQIAPLIGNIQARGYVTFYELMKIGAWKAARPLANLTLKKTDEHLMEIGRLAEKEGITIEEAYTRLLWE
jgi:hypothetical protein